MNNLIFHDNFHRSNHHTIQINGYPESSKDPIASFEYPFEGLLYNNLYNIEGSFISKTNSYDWWSVGITVNLNYDIWNKYRTTYTTVCSYSAFWDLDVYNTFKYLSSNFESTYSTLCSNIQYWNAVYYENTMFSNKVQENIRQKTFKSLQLNPIDSMNITMDLSAGQVSTYTTPQSCNFNNFIGEKKGGIYHLLVVLDAKLNSVGISFNKAKYVFPNNKNTYSISSGISAIKFEFLFDGLYLHGKSKTYELATLPIIPTPTPTPTPTHGFQNNIIKFGNGDSIVRFVNGDYIVTFKPTPTPTPTYVMKNIIRFGNGDSIVKFVNGEYVVVF